MESSISNTFPRKRFAAHGWVGLVLIIVFWTLNWGLEGQRSQWGFFPLWLGYCLTVDALVLYRTGTSLLTRGWRKYISLFMVSAPAWWIFEAANARLQNWQYLGVGNFNYLTYAALATLSFTTVMPAVFGTAELASSFNFIKRLGKGPAIHPDRQTTLTFFTAGLVMMVMMIAWPRIFFPFVWLSLFFIIEPVNIWLGNRTITKWTTLGDWRPVIALWSGVLVTAFFWEMWNYFSYPKWVYHVPWGGCCHIFEMPLLGYGGYLPFALELFALYHLVMGIFKQKKINYLFPDIQPH